MEWLLKRYWEETIENYWSRPNFKVDVTVLDKRSDGWPRFRSLIWTLALTLDPDTRPTYHRLGGKAAAMGGAIMAGTGVAPGLGAVTMTAGAAIGQIANRKFYSGVSQDTIAHEFGHWIGMDDEYDEDGMGEAKHCDSKWGARDNIMCDKSIEPVCLTGQHFYGSECQLPETEIQEIYGDGQRADREIEAIRNSEDGTAAKAAKISEIMNARRNDENARKARNAAWVDAYKKKMIDLYARTDLEREELEKLDYGRRGQASLYYGILTRRYQIGSWTNMGAPLDTHDHPKINLKICSEDYKKSFDDGQADQLCGAAYVSKCGKNSLKERKVNCNLLGQMNNGENLVKNCKWCNTEFLEDDFAANEIPEDANEGSGGGIYQGEGQEVIFEDVEYPDEYEYPK